MMPLRRITSIYNLCLLILFQFQRVTSSVNINSQPAQQSQIRICDASCSNTFLGNNIKNRTFRRRGNYASPVKINHLNVSRTKKSALTEDLEDEVDSTNGRLWPPWPFNLIGRKPRGASIEQSNPRGRRDLDLFWVYFFHRSRTGLREIQGVCSEISYHFPPAFPALMVALIPEKAKGFKPFEPILTRASAKRLAVFSLGISILSWTNYELCKKKRLVPLPLKDIYADYKQAILPPFLPEEVPPAEIHSKKDNIFANVDKVDLDDKIVQDVTTIAQNNTIVNIPALKKQLKQFYKSAPKPKSFALVMMEWKKMRQIRYINEAGIARNVIKEQLLALQQLKKGAEENKTKKNKRVNSSTNSIEKPLGYALVTGASRGIGRALAVELARFEIPLVLVARNLERLTALANDLEACYGIKCCVLQADLSQPDTARRIYNTTKEAGINVDILVNNAGSITYGEIVESQSDDVSNLINLNALSTAMLSQLYGKDMKSQKRGRILFVSSVVGATPSGPNVGAYAATKAFEKSFSLSLGKELERYGVGVTCLIPGAVKTGFATNSGIEEAVCWKIPFYPMTASSVASRGVRALLKGDPEVCPGWHNRLFVKILAPIFPQRLNSMIVEFTFSPLNMRKPGFPWEDKKESNEPILTSEYQVDQGVNQKFPLRNLGKDMPPRLLVLPKENILSHDADNIIENIEEREMVDDVETQDKELEETVSEPTLEIENSD